MTLRFNPLVTVAILLVITVIGATYMWVSVLRINPAKTNTRLTVLLEDSGGLMATSRVALRGIDIGRVETIRTTATGLAVGITVSQPVPVSSTISIANLSAAGEQYLDFQAAKIEPPYIAEGTVIPADAVAPTVTVSDALAKLNALVAAVQPADLHDILAEVSTALGTDRTVDDFALAAQLLAKRVNDSETLLAALFSHITDLTVGFDELHVGDTLAQTGNKLPDVIPGFRELITQFHDYSYVGNGVWEPADPIGGLLAKVGDYAYQLSGPLGTFGAVLAPISEPLRPIRVNAGHWLDFWESTFADDGAVRVQLDIANQPSHP